MENRSIKLFKTAEIYLYVTIFCVLFGAVYEYFSYGVYSYFMIYAFMWPLILGVLPFMIMSRRAGKDHADYRFWHAGVATLTVGSVFQGIVKIYGTSSPYTMGYMVVGCALLGWSLLRNKVIG